MKEEKLVAHKWLVDKMLGEVMVGFSRGIEVAKLLIDRWLCAADKPTEN